MKQQILSQLSPDFPWNPGLHWFDSIGSTNDESRRMARAGAPHGTTLIAGQQTGGHGRRGRSFHSPAGSGVYLSIILRPGCLPTELMHLTCAAGVAMCDALESVTGLRPGIKWTNDLVYGKRKLGGILTELGFAPDGTVAYAIVGIGINCCQKPEDFPQDIRDMAGSLAMMTGKPVDRAKVAAAMMEALHAMDTLLLPRKAQLLERYRRDCITLGQEILLVRGEERRTGHALDIDDEGALIVAFPSGITEIVNSGEVSVRGMYGYL